jgi:uncharacterized membrane protein
MDYAQLLFYSSLISAIVLFILIIAVRKFNLGSIFKKSLPKSLLLGLLNPFLYYLVLFKAYSLLQAQEAMVLNYTWPIMVSILAGIFLKHKLSLKFYDILGQEITTHVNAEQKPGLYSVEFNASGLTSGIYLYKLSVTCGIGNFTNVKKMILIR